MRFGRTRYQLLYRRSNQFVVLLHVFEKNTGAIPARDIRTAQHRSDDFRARMDAKPKRPPRPAGRDAQCPADLPVLVSLTHERVLDQPSRTNGGGTQRATRSAQRGVPRRR
ncbi:hypothetical protein [Conexibacter sp. DBS9H8]|uniref:hypothetical protein n=1 Tax=Conexibacter sp. DBS9H8 TaxID=2937801 RepID=UPI0035314039